MKRGRGRPETYTAARRKLLAPVLAATERLPPNTIPALLPAVNALPGPRVASVIALKNAIGRLRRAARQA